jgi:CRP-like cAMP-binding protein
MDAGALGREYADQEVICRQGEPGDWMFVIQAGRAVAIREAEDTKLVVGEMAAGDVFGEMAIFDRQPRSATVQAKGKARVLTLDKRAFLRRVHDDPSLAFRMFQKMSARIRSLNEELLQLKGSQQGERSQPSGWR